LPAQGLNGSNPGRLFATGSGGIVSPLSDATELRKTKHSRVKETEVQTVQKATQETVYLVGTSTTTRGGIGYVIGAYLSSELSSRFRLIHLVTHRDGSALLKAWTYAKALMRFVVLRLTCGSGLVHIHSSSGPSFLRKALFFLASKALG